MGRMILDHQGDVDGLLQTVSSAAFDLSRRPNRPACWRTNFKKLQIAWHWRADDCGKRAEYSPYGKNIQTSVEQLR
jgi:hypothetical protein